MANKPIKADQGIKDGASDKVYTPDEVAKYLINLLPIKDSDVLLDPCRGQGAFYNNFPELNIKLYCEIDEGIDFFNFNDKVDWIITNPPYSIYDAFVKHCFELSNNVALLVPFSKVSSSMKRIKAIKEYGGIKNIWFLSAARCGFPFGFPCGFIWYQRGYNDSWNVIEKI